MQHFAIKTHWHADVPGICLIPRCSFTKSEAVFTTTLKALEARINGGQMLPFGYILR